MLPAVTAAQDDTDKSPLLEIRSLLDAAKDLGAKRNLSEEYRRLEGELKDAEQSGCDQDAIERMRTRGRRLVNAAELLREIRGHKNPLATLLGRYDRSLVEIAALYDLAIPETLTGPAGADALLQALSRRVLARTMLIDSLTVVNRRLQTETVGTIAAQESTLTALQVEVSSLRHRLWETELRAGVAEADRSAAESVLTRRQQREEAIRQIGDTFAAQDGEVVLSPEGEIRVRVFGFTFAVGSATLRTERTDLLENLVAAIGLFPAATIRVEGHTDDTGSRDANQRLSRRRAETVADLLAKRLSLPAERLQSTGLGPDFPIAPNSRPEGRSRNRRIEVVILPAP